MAKSITLNDRYINQKTDVAGIESLTKFNAYFDNRYIDPFIKGYGFVFVTKPSLFLYPIKQQAGSAASTNLAALAYSNMCRDPYFAQFIINEAKNPSDKLLIEQLSYAKNFSSIDSNFSGGNFLPLFTNQLKSFDLSDIVLEQMDAFESKQGYKMPLPTFKTASEGSGSQTIIVNETANLDFTKMMGIWVNYISNISDGTFTANPEFVKSRIIDYMCSIYYFSLAPDGKTLKYWTKLTGCWPTTIPAGNLSYDQGGFDTSQVNLQFNYTSREDMTPSVLEDFNRVVLNESNQVSVLNTSEDYAPIHNSQYLNESQVKSKYNSVWGENGTCPFIVSTGNGSSYGGYQLIFPIDVDSLYTTIKFGGTYDIYNDVNGDQIFTNNFANIKNKR